MKYTKILLTLTSCCLFVASCVKDDSNRDYNEVNLVTISGIESEYTIKMLDTLRIEPILTGSLGSIDDNAYDFLWDIFEGPVGTPAFNRPDTLSTEKVLNIPMTYTPNTYRINLKVTEKKTGVRYRQEFVVRVLSEFELGLMVLSDVGGDAIVTFISVIGEVYPNVYFNINGEHVGRNPVAINMLGRAPLNYVAVLCDDGVGGALLSTMSFVKIFSYSDYFYNPPSVIKPQGLTTNTSVGGTTDYSVFYMRSWIVNDNKLHLKDVNHTVNVDGQVVQVENKFYDSFSGDYEVPSDCIFLMERIVYDNKYQRFMFIPNITQPNIFPHSQIPDNPYFDPGDVGMEFLWGRLVNSPRGMFFVNNLFRNNDDQVVFLRWRANYPSAGNVFPLQKRELPLEWNIHDAQCFTGNMTQDYIFYGVGSAVYMYDWSSNQERLAYDFGGDVRVEKVLFHEAFKTSQEIFIATSQGQGEMNGSIYHMSIAPGGVLSIIASYENVTGKVVDLCWKN